MSRRATSHKAVYAVFFGLLAVALLAAGLLYFGKLRYVPKAARHAPRDASVTARLSVERVGLFDPARTHLMPLVDTVAAPEGVAPRRDRLEQQSKLEFNVDLREVLIAVGPGEQDWVVVFGGMFPQAGWVSRVAKLLEQEGRTGQLASGVWADSAGFFLGQADDGCVVLANSRARLELAIPAGQPVPPRGDLELTLRPGGLELLRAKGLQGGQGAGVSAAHGRAVGTGVEVEIEIGPTIKPQSPAADAFAADLRRLGAGKVQQNGRVVRANFERDGLNRASAYLAAWLKHRLGVAGLDASRAEAP